MWQRLCRYQPTCGPPALRGASRPARGNGCDAARTPHRTATRSRARAGSRRRHAAAERAARATSLDREWPLERRGGRCCPTQILVTTFVYDPAQITTPTDNVDGRFVRKPQRWDVRVIRYFMVLIGAVTVTHLTVAELVKRRLMARLVA